MDHLEQNAQLPQDTPSLLGRIETEWNALHATVRDMGARGRNLPGGWSVKDTLAHIAAWERYLSRHHLGGRPAHEALEMDEGTYRRLDQDGINEFLYQRHRGRSWADVQADLRQSHDEVLASLRGMPFAALLEPRYPEDPPAGPLLAWVASNTYEHYREHRQALARIASSPDEPPV